MRRGSGEYRWFLIQVEPARNDLGEIVKWYATNADIEESKADRIAARGGKAGG